VKGVALPRRRTLKWTVARQAAIGVAKVATRRSHIVLVSVCISGCSPETSAPPWRAWRLQLEIIVWPPITIYDLRIDAGGPDIGSDV
jgi:hypothetical protein